MQIDDPAVCRDDPIAFTYYMSYGHMPVPRHHYEWYYSICIDDDHRMVNIIGPRGSAKTTCIENSLSWHIGNDPHTTNMIVSAGSDVAEKRIAKIKEVVGSERFRDVFPSVYVAEVPNRVDQFTVWSTEYVDSNGKRHTGLSQSEWSYFMTMFHNNRDPSLYGAGILNRILGMRITGWIVLDDIHDLLNSATELQRTKIRNVVTGTIMGFRAKGVPVKIINICNRWAEGDFGGYAKEAKNSDGSFTWQTYELDCYNEDGSSYWPEVWPVEDLQKEEDEVGTPAFQATYRNNPFGFSQGLFKPEHLTQDIPDPLPSFDEIYISVDLSYTEGANDYTVATAIGRYKPDKGTYKICILAMIRDRWKLKDSFENIFKFADLIAGTYGFVTSLLFEKQGMQTAVVKEKLQAVLDDRDRLYPFNLVPLMGNKEDRAKWLALKAQNNDLFISQRLMQIHPQIRTELVGFGRAKNDDIVDTLTLPGQLPHWKVSGSVYKSEVKLAQSPYLL